MNSVRQSYVEHFGEEQASAIERAAEEHKNQVSGTERGSDQFKWAILMAIGFECPTRKEFREYHGITVPVAEFKAWCKEHGQLDTHEGCPDYISLFCGTYNEYMPEKQVQP